MATSQELKDAADATAAAKAAIVAAQAAYDAKLLEVDALMPDELATFEAAQAAYQTVYTAKAGEVGLGAALDALAIAQSDLAFAIEALTAAAASYDGA